MIHIYTYINIYIWKDHLGEQHNCDVPEIQLKIYGIRQALLFFCCTGFRTSIYVFTKYIETDRRILSFCNLLSVCNSMLSIAFIFLNVSCR